MVDVQPTLAWARLLIAIRPAPDFTVFAGGKPQLQRWYVVPRNDVMNVYLHRFLLSDEHRALHDHRGDNRSWVLDGEYTEVLGDVNGIERERIIRRAGDVVDRRATDPHRVIVDQPTISLFFIGPITRDWGFYCPRGFVLWEEFVKVVPGGNDLGVGCG